MDKFAPKYICVIILVIISAAVTYWAVSRPPIVLGELQSETMPPAIGEWVVPEDGVAEISKDSLEGWMAQKKDFLYSRYYREVDNDETMTMIDDIVDLMLIYKGNERRGWHVSEMCFSGSGYNVTQSTTTIPYGGNENSPAVKLVAINPATGRGLVALYWFANGKRSEANFWKQQGEMVMTRLTRPENGWAFMRVTSPIKFSENETTEVLKDFIRDASDDLVKRVSVKK